MARRTLPQEWDDADSWADAWWPPAPPPPVYVAAPLPAPVYVAPPPPPVYVAAPLPAWSPPPPPAYLESRPRPRLDEWEPPDNWWEVQNPAPALPAYVAAPLPAWEPPPPPPVYVAAPMPAAAPAPFDPYGPFRRLPAEAFNFVAGQNGQPFYNFATGNFEGGGAPDPDSWQAGAAFLSLFDASPYATKYWSRDGIAAVGDGRLSMTWQQPGAHKYDTMRATYGRDPGTGEWVLEGDPMLAPTRQVSSAEDFRDMVEEVGAVAAAAVALYFGGAALAGASSAGTGAAAVAFDPVGAYLTTGAVEGSTIGGSLLGGGGAGAVGAGSAAGAVQAAQSAALAGVQNGGINGVLSELQGGDFVDGFGAGFASGAIGSGIGAFGIPEAVGVTYQPAVAAINSGLSGGLIAEAQGGQFEQGFESGAVASIINSGLQAFPQVVAEWTAPPPPLPEPELAALPAPGAPVDLAPARWWEAPLSAPVPALPPLDLAPVPDFAALPEVPGLPWDAAAWQAPVLEVPAYVAPQVAPWWEPPPPPAYVAPPVDLAPMPDAPGLVWEAASWQAPPEPAALPAPGAPVDLAPARWWEAPLSAPVPALPPLDLAPVPAFAPLPLVPTIPALPVFIPVATPAPAAREQPRAPVTARDVQRAIGVVSALLGGGPPGQAAPGARAPGAPAPRSPGTPGAVRPADPLPVGLVLGAGILAALALF